MSRNIEVKAYCADLESARRHCEQLHARLVRRHQQKDTYFAVPDGRLKLRESDQADPCLLLYHRLDMPAVRESAYTMVKLPPHSEELLSVLSEAIGVTTVIEKQRDTYELDSALFNLDAVPGLGTFIEIEVDAEQVGSDAKAEEIARQHMQKLGVADADIVPWSYAEMQAMYRNARTWRDQFAAAARKGTLFLIDGPSASGKTSLSQMLHADRTLGLEFVRRYCTRTPRATEQNEYTFVNRLEFRNLAKGGDFVEYRDYLFGMSYGLSWADAMKPMIGGAKALALMNWGNARHVRRVFPEAKLILINAPPEDLRRRLLARGIHDDAQLTERLDNARRLAGNNSDYDLVVTNRDGSLDDSLGQLRRFVLDH